MGLDQYRCIVKPQARTEILEIFAYLSQFSLAHADKVVLQLTAAINSLEFLPKSHLVREKRRDDRLTVYWLVTNPYLVYYRVSDVDLIVDVLTVRHGVRRQPRRFR